MKQNRTGERRKVKIMKKSKDNKIKEKKRRGKLRKGKERKGKKKRNGGNAVLIAVIIHL